MVDQQRCWHRWMNWMLWNFHNGNFQNVNVLWCVNVSHPVLKFHFSAQYLTAQNSIPMYWLHELTELKLWQRKTVAKLYLLPPYCNCFCNMSWWEKLFHTISIPHYNWTARWRLLGFINYSELPNTQVYTNIIFKCFILAPNQKACVGFLVPHQVPPQVAEEEHLPDIVGNMEIKSGQWVPRLDQNQYLLPCNERTDSHRLSERSPSIWQNTIALGKDQPEAHWIRNKEMNWWWLRHTLRWKDNFITKGKLKK